MAIDWTKTVAALWRPRTGALRPARRLDTVRLDSLLGVERQKRGGQYRGWPAAPPTMPCSGAAGVRVNPP